MNTTPINWRVIRLASMSFVLLVSIILFFVVKNGRLFAPSPAEAYAEIFDRNPPDSFSNVHYRYVSRNKLEYEHYLSFTLSSDDLLQFMARQGSFELVEDGVPWKSKPVFEQLYDGKLPDLELASIHKNNWSGTSFELVVAISCDTVFCHFVSHLGK